MMNQAAKQPTTPHTATRSNVMPATPHTIIHNGVPCVAIPLDVYHLYILDEIETIKVILSDIQGALSALHYAKLSELQIKGIAGNALHLTTTLYDITDSLVDKASQYLPNQSAIKG